MSNSLTKTKLGIFNTIYKGIVPSSIELCQDSNSVKLDELELTLLGHQVYIYITSDTFSRRTHWAIQLNLFGSHTTWLAIIADED